MQKAGLGATGILANISRAAGFDSVSALLKQNPHAQVQLICTLCLAGPVNRQTAAALASGQCRL